MAFRQIKTPAIASAAVTNTKLDKTAISGQTSTNTVGSLANDTILLYSAVDDALRRVTVSGVLNSFTTDNLIEGTTNLWFTDQRAKDAVAQDIADAVNTASGGLSTDLSALETALNNEISRATTAEGALQSAIDAEEIARIAGDLAITTAFEAADAAINIRVDNILNNTDEQALNSLAEIVAEFQQQDSALTAAINANSANISTEITNRQTADAALQTQITNLQSELDRAELGSGLNADGTYTANISAHYTSSAVSLKSADNLLDAALWTEANTRSQAVTDLQTELDATQVGAGLAANGGYSANLAATYLDTATSLKNADDLLDQAINAEVIRAKAAEAANAQGLADEINARASAITSVRDDFAIADLGIQNELDATQAGAGLNTDGTYAPNNLMNYIDVATSLHNADELLDGTIKTEVDRLDAAIASLTGGSSTTNVELDATQAAVGVAANGSYVARTGTNYIDTATTIAEEIGLIDIALGAESTTRAANDLAQQTEINAIETATGLLANGTFDPHTGTNYINSATSMRGVDIILDQQIKIVNNRVDFVEANTDPAAIDSLSELLAAFTQMDADLSGAITSNTTAINNEVTRATAAETSLQNAIDAEASTRAAADTLLQTNINNEATTRATSDTALQTNITAEATTRAAADTALQNELDATQVGAGLGTDGVYTASASTAYLTTASSLFDADVKLDAQLQSELNRAQLVEANLQTEINTTQTGAGLTTTGTYTARTTSNYLNTSTSLYHADTLLDAALKAQVTNLQNQLDNLGNDGSSVQAELDQTQTGAGLNTNGTYTPDASTNYITGAASLKNADFLLDGAIKSVDLAYKAADITLQNNIDAEELRAITAEGQLNTQIGNEVTARTSADAALDSRVTTNEGDIASLQASITNEIAAREGGDLILSNRVTITEGDITTLESRVDAILGGSSTDLDTFIEVVNAFQTADSDINAAITQLAADATQARSDLETALQTQITTNNTARINGDANLQAELDATQSGAGLNTDGGYQAHGVYNVTTNPTGARYIGNATTLAGADKLLDEQLYSITTDIYSQITTLQGGGNGLQDELDATQAGAGLTATGGYTANGSANYIQAAVSLKNADDLLDTALKAEETARVNAVSALNGELTDTQIGAGLATNGAYTPHVGTNYIDTATSLHNADSKLDSAIKAEVDRATTAEGVLTTNLATETTNRVNADNTLQANIDAENTRATGVESGLQSQITANLNEITTTQAGAGLNTTGSYTAYGAYDAGTNPSGAYYMGTASNLRGADKLLDTALKAEEVARIAADNSLNSAIVAESTTRSTADSALQTAIDDEEAARIAADSNLQSQIDAALGSGTTESQARIAADADLQTQIDNIISNTDATALNSLSELATALTSMDTDLQGAITANATTIGVMQTEIDQIETATGLATNGTFIAHTGTNYIDGATSMFSVDELLDTAIKTVDTAVRTDFAAADAAQTTALQANIDTKVSKAGDVMSGVLNMGSNKVTNLATGTAASDAVNKGQMDTALAAQHISQFTTDALAEGISNLYFTDVRATDAVNASAYTFPTTVGTEGQGLRFDATGNLVVADVASTLLQLTDVVETSYTGKQNYVLAINSTEDGVAFVDPTDLVYITNQRQVLNGDGVQTVFALNFYTTQADALVFVGGVIQDPDTHYTINSTNQEITFTSSLPLGTQAVVIVNPVGNVPYVGPNTISHEQLADNVKAYEQQPDVVSGTAGAVVDSFSATLYRTAKYVIQVSDGAGAFESREALVVHDGTNAYITEYALVYTGAGLLGDASVQVNAGQVELVYTANGEGYTVTVIATYIDA